MVGHSRVEAWGPAFVESALCQEVSLLAHPASQEHALPRHRAVPHLACLPPGAQVRPGPLGPRIPVQGRPLDLASLGVRGNLRFCLFFTIDVQCSLQTSAGQSLFPKNEKCNKARSHPRLSSQEVALLASSPESLTRLRSSARLPISACQPFSGTFPCSKVLHLA